jgi:hypothetical protein
MEAIEAFQSSRSPPSPDDASSATVDGDDTAAGARGSSTPSLA